MPRKRTTNICSCGCGNVIPRRIDPLTGKDKGQGHRSSRNGGYYIPGHGRKMAGIYRAEDIKEYGHPQEKPIGSTYVDKGYVFEKIGNQNWVAQHRLVTNTTDSKIHVHHKDHNPLNNALENLEVLTASVHASMHRRLPEHQWAKNYIRCTVCLTTDRSHHSGGLCALCLSRQRNGSRPRLGVWSLDHKQCVECGTTTRRHRGKGLCRLCYIRKWNQEQKDKKATPL